MCCLLIPAEPPSQVAKVLGKTPAVSVAIHATQAVKAITGAGRWLAGRLLRNDGLALAFGDFKIN